MQITHTTSIALGFICVSTAAFKLPENLPDGVYTGTHNPTTGDVDLKLVTSLPSSSTQERGDLSTRLKDRTLQKRDSYGCSSIVLDSSGWSAASEGLWNFCNDGGLVPSDRYVTVTSSNNVVWYVCNYNGNTEACPALDVFAVANNLNAVCGEYVSGWWWVSDINTTFGSCLAGDSICDNL